MLKKIKNNIIKFKLLKFVIFSLSLFITGCSWNSKELVSDLSERDANEIIVLLYNKGIVSTKTQSSTEGKNKEILWNVSVSKNDYKDSVTIISINGLPRKIPPSMLDIFSNTGYIQTDIQEKIRFYASLADQISAILRKMDGILEADVILTLPEEKQLIAETKMEISASVYIKHSGIMDDVNQLMHTKIKQLVSSSVSGLNPENVSIVSDIARIINNNDYSVKVTEKDVEYGTFWGVNIELSSIFRFKVIMSSLALLLLIFSLFSFWCIWKCHLFIFGWANIKSFFSIAPLTPDNVTNGEKKEVNVEIKKDSTKEENKKDKPKLVT